MRHSSASKARAPSPPEHSAAFRAFEVEREKTDRVLEKCPSLTDILLAGNRRAFQAIDRALSKGLLRVVEEQESVRSLVTRKPPLAFHATLRERADTLGEAFRTISDLIRRVDGLKLSSTEIPGEISPLTAAQTKELLGAFRALRDQYWDRLYRVPIVQRETIAAVRAVVVEGKTPTSCLNSGAANGVDDERLREEVARVHSTVSAILTRIGERQPRAREREALARALRKTPLDSDDLNELFSECSAKRDRLAELEIGLRTSHRSFRAAERAGDPRCDEWRALVDELGGTAIQARATLEEVRSLYQPYQRIKQYIAASNHRFVHSTVLRNMHSKPWHEDLAQEGMIGMMRAIEKFDVDSGLSLLTYASYWVFQKAARESENFGGLVRVPCYQQKVLRQIRKNRVPGDRHSGESQALALGASPRDIESLRPFVNGVTSLDVEHPSAERRFARDLVVDHRALEVSEGADRALRGEMVRAALAELTQRERFVITARFGLDGQPPRTLVQVGQELGLTRERIRQIEASVLLRLRYGGFKRVFDNFEQDLQE